MKSHTAGCSLHKAVRHHSNVPFLEIIRKRQVPFYGYFTCPAHTEELTVSTDTSLVSNEATDVFTVRCHGV